MQFLTSLLAVILSLPLTAGQWQVQSEMPTARQELYATTHAGQIYIPGGVLNDGTSDAFEAYNLATNSWSTLAPLPLPRHHITPAAVGGKIYAMGGFDGGFPNWELKSDTFVYDIESNSWQTGTAIPQAMGEHVVAVVKGRVHLIGGRVRGELGDNHFDAYVDTDKHYIYDPATDKWSEGAPAPTARNSAAAAVIDGMIYVVGGRWNKIEADGKQVQQNLGTLEVYDPATDAWKTLAPMPEGLGGNAAAAVDGKLYVFGGEQWAPSQKVFASAWKYAPATDNWERLADMPTGRHGLAAASVNGTVVTIGGCTKVGGGAVVGSTEALTP